MALIFPCISIGNIYINNKGNLDDHSSSRLELDAWKMFFLLFCHHSRINVIITNRKNEAKKVTITITRLFGLRGFSGMVGPEIKR